MDSNIIDTLMQDAQHICSRIQSDAANPSSSENNPQVQQMNLAFANSMQALLGLQKQRIYHAVSNCQNVRPELHDKIVDQLSELTRLEDKVARIKLQICKENESSGKSIARILTSFGRETGNFLLLCPSILRMKVSSFFALKINKKIQ